MCLTYATQFYLQRCAVIYCYRAWRNTFSPFSIISVQHEVSIIYAFYYWQSLQPIRLTVVAVCARGWLIPCPSTHASPDYHLFDSYRTHHGDRLFRPYRNSYDAPIRFEQFHYCKPIAIRNSKYLDKNLDKIWSIQCKMNYGNKVFVLSRIIIRFEFFFFFFFLYN